MEEIPVWRSLQSRDLLVWQSSKAVTLLLGLKPSHKLNSGFPEFIFFIPFPLRLELWSAHPWRGPRKAWTWHSVLWAGWQNWDQSQPGLSGLGGLFQPKWLWDSVILEACPGLFGSVAQPRSHLELLAELGLEQGWQSWSRMFPPVPAWESGIPGAWRDLWRSSPAQAGSPGAGDTGTHPGGFGKSPERDESVGASSPG